MPDLRTLLDREADGARGSSDGFERTLAQVRKRQRGRRWLALAVGLAVFAAGLGTASVAFLRGRDAVAPSTPRTRITLSPLPTEPDRFWVARVKLVSSSRTRLVIESPPGIVRWSTNGCDVTGRGLTPGGPNGGFGGACAGPDAYLSGGVGALGGSDGRIYYVANGRTLPVGGVVIRLTLIDGRKVMVQPREGFWILVIVAQPNGHYCFVRSFEALTPEGRVLSRIEGCHPAG